MSPCLRLFIESLLDEVGEHGVARRGSQKRDFQPALSRVIKRKELSEDCQH